MTGDEALARDGSAIEVAAMVADDAELISAAFRAIGWEKPVALYQRYLAEQGSGERMVFVARVEGTFAGYATLLWTATYVPFGEVGIPEIQDLNVMPAFRRIGVGARLLEAAEDAARSRADVVGIAVGLHRDYGAAQRLYASRGYLPDGRGVAYDGRPVEPMDTVTVDDRLTLHLTKTLGSRTR